MEIITYTCTFVILCVVTYYLWKYYKANFKKSKVIAQSTRLVCGMSLFAISMAYRSLYNSAILIVEHSDLAKPAWIDDTK